MSTHDKNVSRHWVKEVYITWKLNEDRQSSQRASGYKNSSGHDFLAKTTNVYMIHEFRTHFCKANVSCDQLLNALLLDRHHMLRAPYTVMISQEGADEGLFFQLYRRMYITNAIKWLLKMLRQTRERKSFPWASDSRGQNKRRERNMSHHETLFSSRVSVSFFCQWDWKWNQAEVQLAALNSFVTKTQNPFVHSNGRTKVALSCLLPDDTTSPAVAVGTADEILLSPSSSFSFGLIWGETSHELHTLFDLSIKLSRRWRKRQTKKRVSNSGHRGKVIKKLVWELKATNVNV